MSTTELDVQPLTQGRFADLAAPFEEGGDEKLTTGEIAPGLVAYQDGRAVGWVSLGPREDYERLAYSKILAPVDDVPVWSIVCFVVSRRARRQGIAARLLDAGIVYVRSHGATTLEAYPVEVPDGERIPSANAYHGALSMFQRAGFREVERRTWNVTSRARPIVGLDLDVA